MSVDTVVEQPQPVKEIHSYIMSSVVSANIPNGGLAARMAHTFHVDYLIPANQDEALYYVDNSNGRVLTKNGELSDDINEEDDYASYEDSVERAKRFLINKLSTRHGVSTKDVVVKVEITGVMLSSVPFTEYNKYPFSVEVYKDEHGYGVRHMGKYQSKLGNWHRYPHRGSDGTRFARNHFFSYDEAISRAKAFLETL